MEKVIGKNLDVNSIDIFPYSVGHNGEYLKVGEKSYELLDASKANTKLTYKYTDEIPNALNKCSQNLFRYDLQENELIFNVTAENPLTITFPNYQTKTFIHIEPIYFFNHKNQIIVIDSDGEADSYNVDQYVYDEDEVVIGYSYYWEENGKEVFNVQTLIDKNDIQNFESRYKFENISVQQSNLIYHNLDYINNEYYKTQVNLICVKDNLGYVKDDVVKVDCYIDNQTLGFNNIQILNKITKQKENISDNCWVAVVVVKEL